MKRVVITNVGVVSPNANSFKEFSNALKNGKSGLQEIDYFNAKNFLCKIVGQVNGFNETELFEKFPSLKKVNDRKVLFAIKAFLEAFNGNYENIKDANLNFGTSLESFFIEKIFQYSPYSFKIDEYIKKLNENRDNDRYLQLPLDYFGSFLKKEFGVQGKNYINCSACAASTQAIGHSFHMIRSERVKKVICGGFDSMLNPLGLGGFSVLGALNTDNSLMEKSIRPFDVRRKGTILGEGAAIFMLQDLETAISSGSEIFGEVVGYASTFDAFKLSEPDREARGIENAMKRAIDDAQISSDEINYINAHGTGTPLNDKIETMAIKKVFGDQAYDIPISSIKSMIGHSIGASGAVEIAGVLAMIKNGFISPTINLEKNDPDCDLNYVPNQSISKEVNYVLKNSMGFGGQNATIILKRYEK